MDHRTLDPDHRLSSHAAKQAFKDLLLEAYREREALMRVRVMLSPAPHDAVATDPPLVSRAEGPRPREWSKAESSRRAKPPRLLEVDTAGLRIEHAPRLSNNGPVRLNPRNDAESRPFSVLSHQQGRVALRPEIAALLKPAADRAIRLPAVVGRNLLEAFVPSREKEVNHDVALDRLWRRGLVFIAVFGGALGFWLVATTMSSAVIGSGQFVVDGSVKKIQHPTGGVVSQLLVRDGDHVSEGDLLISLDETVTRSNFQVIVGQLDELAGRKARLEAEREGNEAFDTPVELSGRLSDPEVARIIAAERKLFQARNSARESRRAQLTKRIAQLQDEILGLRSQLDANSRETQIITEELKGVRELYAKQLTPIMRLSALERQAVTLIGQKGQLTAAIAQIEGKIAEIELQITQIGEDLRAETQKELREVQGKIAELSERRAAAQDLLKRVELRAPSSGTVHQLAVHTVGGVITAAEPAMVIVPNKEELIVEARVMPPDRDQLQVGQKVVVRIHSTNQRNTPELNGTLTRIAADVSKDATTSAPFYAIRITVAKAELARLRGISISAGMQAEVFIEAGSRSPLSYLLRPLNDQVSRAFKER